MKKKLWSSAKADLEFSHWIRDRDKTKCFFCKKKGSQNSHFWGRRHSSTRYLAINCDYICGGCHMRNEADKQGLYRDLKLKQLGEEGYIRLERLHNKSVKRADAIQAVMILINGYD